MKKPDRYEVIRQLKSHGFSKEDLAVILGIDDFEYKKLTQKQLHVLCVVLQDIMNEEKPNPRQPSRNTLRLLNEIKLHPNNRWFALYESITGWNEAERNGWVERRVNTAVLTPTGSLVLSKYKNPRFDTPQRKKSKDKWWAIVAYNGTQLLARQVISLATKSRASNFSKDLVGKSYKGKLVTTVVLEGPFPSMMSASNAEVVLPLPA